VSEANQTNPPTQPSASPKQASGAPQQPIKITPEILAANNYPKAGFYLAVFGGLLIAIEGLVAIFFESLFYAINEDIWAGLSMVLIGIILLIIGGILSGAAVSLLVKPELRKSAGVTIIICALVGALFGGGWVAGSVLGIFGGLLAIIWKPKAT
jgi:hypothetical protein